MIAFTVIVLLVVIFAAALSYATNQLFSVSLAIAFSVITFIRTLNSAIEKVKEQDKIEKLQNSAKEFVDSLLKMTDENIKLRKEAESGTVPSN